MRKLNEFFEVLQFQKRIVAAVTILGNTVYYIQTLHSEHLKIP